MSTYFDEIPECEMATVMKEFLVRLIGLRAKFPRERILIQKMDVKSAFRQIPVDPAGAPAFAYIVRGFLVVDLRLQFGWRGSPGWFGVVASAIEAEHRRTTKNSVKFNQAGIRTTKHVKIAQQSGKQIVSVPEQCRVQEVEGGGVEDPAWTRFFVDDAISMEVQHEAEGGRCLALTTG
ncbi:unnamed protein product, partial [Pylaiella littoralis]